MSTASRPDHADHSAPSPVGRPSDRHRPPPGKAPSEGQLDPRHYPGSPPAPWRIPTTIPNRHFSAPSCRASRRPVAEPGCWSIDSRSPAAARTGSFIPRLGPRASAQSAWRRSSCAVTARIAAESVAGDRGGRRSVPSRREAEDQLRRQAGQEPRWRVPPDRRQEGPPSPMTGRISPSRSEGRLEDDQDNANRPQGRASPRCLATSWGPGMPSRAGHHPPRARQQSAPECGTRSASIAPAIPRAIRTPAIQISRLRRGALKGPINETPDVLSPQCYNVMGARRLL